MKHSQKTKKITKKDAKNKAKQIQQENQNQQTNGDPLIKNLNDFVTAISPIYTSKPIYTGGRILTSHQKLYASCNNQISVYCLKTKKMLSKIKHKNEQIINFGICPLEKTIITYTSSNLLRSINIQTQKTLQVVKLSAKFYVYDIAFSGDSKFVAVGFSNSMIKIYTLQTMNQTHSYKHHHLPVKKIQWHKNVDLLQIISVDEAKTLVVFDYILNKMIGQIKEAGKNFVLSTKGTALITTCDQQIKVFDYKSLQLQYKISAPDYIDAIFYLQGERLIFGGEETQLFNLDLNDPKHIIKSQIKCPDVGIMKIIPINHKSFVVVSAQQNLTLVDSKNLAVIQTIVGYNDEIIDLKYSKSTLKYPTSSDFLIMVTNSNNVKILNRHSQKLISFVSGHQDTVLCCQYIHPFLITAGKDKIIKLWQIDPLGRSKLIANYRGHSQYVCGVTFLIKSKIIVSVSQDKTIKLWPLCQQKQHKIQIKSALNTVSAHEKSINAVRVSPNQDYIATCSHDRTVKIWDATNLRLYFTLAGHKRGVWDAAFHQIEKMLVTVAGDGALKGWSLFNGECIWSLGTGFAIIRCQWIYYNQVVTGSIDGIIKIWDVRKQTSLSYDKHQGKIWALDVHKNQDNKVEIISGGNDSIYHVWKDSTQQIRDNIIRQTQIEQQQKIHYQQHLHNKQYLLAAKTAFDGNYTQLFIKVVNQMFTKYEEDQEVQINEEGKIIAQSDENLNQKVKMSEVKELVKHAFQTDKNRLFNLIYMMTTTVKSYKAASILFLELLKSQPLQKTLQIQKSFTLASKTESLSDLSAKQSDLQIFIEKMTIFTQKHLNRIERYIRGTYWLQNQKLANLD